MSEYWKSTPNTWCKYCSTYVRDTPAARTAHDASPRHQNGVQRALRTLHNAQERGARDTARAQAEVRRLNGLVGGSTPGTGTVSSPNTPAPRKEARAATLEDRRRQMAQLAALGVSVPSEFRGDVAQQGTWTTVGTRVLPDAEAEDTVKTEPGAESFGVRKRKDPDEDEDDDQDADQLREDAARANARRPWGSRLKVVRGTEDGVDIAALVGGATGTKSESNGEVKLEETGEGKTEEQVGVKTEDGEEEKDAAPAVVFKKRRKNRAA